jgi:hypothetical protein
MQKSRIFARDSDFAAVANVQQQLPGRWFRRRFILHISDDIFVKRGARLSSCQARTQAIRERFARADAVLFDGTFPAVS